MSKENAAKAFQEFLKSDEGKGLSGIFAIDCGENMTCAMVNINGGQASDMALAISHSVYMALEKTEKNA